MRQSDPALERAESRAGRAPKHEKALRGGLGRELESGKPCERLLRAAVNSFRDVKIQLLYFNKIHYEIHDTGNNKCRENQG